MNIIIAVATHKNYELTPNFSPYKTIFTTEKELPDKNFCELSALYEFYSNKNGEYDADYKGLVHYRRYFADINKKKAPLSLKNAELLLSKHNIILPKKRNYFIETNYSHYIHAHNSEGIDVAFEIIREMYSKYVQSIDIVKNRTYAHMFNMFLMSSDYFDNYLEFMFGVLFELQKRLNISKWNQNEQRVFGFVSELLLDIWLDAEKLEYFELPVFYTEGDNLLKKGTQMLLRKFK